MIKELRIEIDGYSVKVPVEIKDKTDFIPLEEAAVSVAAKMYSKKLDVEYKERFENAKCLADKFMFDREHKTVVRHINNFINILLGRSNENAE